MYIILTIWDSDVARMELGVDNMRLETCASLTQAKKRADVIVESDDFLVNTTTLRIYDVRGELMLTYDEKQGFMVRMAGVRAFRAEDKEN